ARHFDSRVAFDFPPGAFNFSLGFLLRLGAASRICVYDYLGYYDVCYIGDEVENPGRVIPRSIIISTIAVAVIYLAINLSIIGVVPWRDFVPAEARPQSHFIVSLLMERMYGSGVATLLTAMILWTAFGSVFALLLGYSRVPYAAAQDGYFFKVFARLHPSKGFPHVSLVMLGVLSILAGFVSLGMVIDALITTRILVQFIGQIGAVTLLRRRAPDLPRPYRMWLYPLPSLIALLGWIFIFATTPPTVVAFGLGASRGRPPDPWVDGFAVVHRDGGVIIGNAGFKGPPDQGGMVEIAYGIVPAFEGRGFATEAATALVAFAFASERVRLVRAHT